MLQPGGDADLALEPLGAERGGELGMEHLERDRAVVAEVLGEVHRGHAAAPQLALEPVSVAEGGLERGAEISHWSSQGSWTLVPDGGLRDRGSCWRWRNLRLLRRMRGLKEVDPERSRYRL